MGQLAIKLHGVRGSRPTHKTGLMGFGGNSTCVEFRLADHDFYLFLDGGSGLVNRGRELTAQPDNKQFHFLMTHTHWDHILGLPFFEPFYNERNQVTFHAADTKRASFEQLFQGLMRQPNVPVPADAIKASLTFAPTKPNQRIQLCEDVTVDTYQLNHQGVTLGFRVNVGDKSGCVITDNAPIEGNYMGEGMVEASQAGPSAFEQEFNEGLVAFLRDADVVVFDTHFTEENLKADWGHSTPQRALDICAKAHVKKLALFHHAPEDLDADVIAKVTSIRADGLRKGVQVVAAKEGDEF